MNLFEKFKVLKDTRDIKEKLLKLSYLSVL